MARTAFALIALINFACSTAPTAAAPSNAVAIVTIEAIMPPPGAEIGPKTVIEADIRYVIENFDPRSEYYLAPLFVSNEGSGMTFNEFRRITDGWKLTQPSGIVRVQYPIHFAARTQWSYRSRILRRQLGDCRRASRPRVRGEAHLD